MSRFVRLSAAGVVVQVGSTDAAAFAYMRLQPDGADLIEIADDLAVEPGDKYNPATRKVTRRLKPPPSLPREPTPAERRLAEYPSLEVFQAAMQAFIEGDRGPAEAWVRERKRIDAKYPLG